MAQIITTGMLVSLAVGALAWWISGSWLWTIGSVIAAAVTCAGVIYWCCRDVANTRELG